MTIDAFERNFWILIRPAEDIPGQWVGHCLDLDILSVGISLTHAMEMTAEAVCECVADDLAHGRSPLERRAAPVEFYEELRRVQSKGQYAQADRLPSDVAVIAAVQFKVRAERVFVQNETSRAALGGSEPRLPCVERLPPAWLITQFNAAARHVGV